MESKKNCTECGKNNREDASFCEYCGSKIKETAPEVPVQEQLKITFDFGILETSRFYITTDKDFYEGMKENSKFVPMITPTDFKEILRTSQESELYIFRILQE